MAENEAPDRRKKAYATRRAIMDYGMGVIFIGLGVFFLLSPKLGMVFIEDDLMRYFFSGLLFLYGGWRIYRGYKKNYFS